MDEWMDVYKQADNMNTASGKKGNQTTTTMKTGLLQTRVIKELGTEG